MTPFEQGKEAGRAAGSWVIDGNTKTETVQRILKGIEEGDPEVMDLQPSPLSGEWAGESITEILGAEATTEDMDAYEEGFSEAFWMEVEQSARAVAQ